MTTALLICSNTTHVSVLLSVWSSSGRQGQISNLLTLHQSSASRLSRQKPSPSTNLQVHHQERLHSPGRLDTGCSHTADRCKCSQSGQSPKRSSSQDTSAAGGTGCSRSHFCILSWTAQAWRLTAAAACSLNWREPKGLKLHGWAADTQKGGGCDHSLVCRQTESQSFSAQSHSALTLLQGPLLQPLIWELNKPTAPAPRFFHQSLMEDSWLLLMSRWDSASTLTSFGPDCTLWKQQFGFSGNKKDIGPWTHVNQMFRTRLLTTSHICLVLPSCVDYQFDLDGTAPPPLFCALHSVSVCFCSLLLLYNRSLKSLLWLRPASSVSSKVRRHTLNKLRAPQQTCGLDLSDSVPEEQAKPHPIMSSRTTSSACDSCSVSDPLGSLASCISDGVQLKLLGMKT